MSNCQDLNQPRYRFIISDTNLVCENRFVQCQTQYGEINTPAPIICTQIKRQCIMEHMARLLVEFQRCKNREN